MRRGEGDVDDPWIMTVKGPSASNSSSSLDSLSSTSSTSSFIPGILSGGSSQSNSLTMSVEDADLADHHPPDEDSDDMDSRRSHSSNSVGSNQMESISMSQQSMFQHHGPHSSSTTATSDEYQNQNAFTKFQKLDQQLQQQKNFQRNRSVSPPSSQSQGPAPIFKNQIHVQNSPVLSHTHANFHRDRGDHMGENNNYGQARPRESPDKVKAGSAQRDHPIKPSTSHHKGNNHVNSSSGGSNGVVASVLTPILIEVCRQNFKLTFLNLFNWE